MPVQRELDMFQVKIAGLSGSHDLSGSQLPPMEELVFKSSPETSKTLGRKLIAGPRILEFLQGRVKLR